MDARRANGERGRERRRERKSDHYIADHNFSFSLHALLIFGEVKVMSGKVTHFFGQQRMGILGKELQKKYMTHT